MVSFDEPSIVAIISRMLMTEYSEINEDIIDAVGEIAT